MPFWAKSHSAGNVFILIDDRTSIFPCHDVPYIQRICNPISGDRVHGLILLQMASPTLFRMRIFNQDGSEASSCGNGLCCLGRFISDLGLTNKKRFPIVVGNTIAELNVEQNEVSVNMGAPVDLQLNIPCELGIIHFVDTGVPHTLHFVQDVSQTNLIEVASYLRHHLRFGKAGTNVNIVSLRNQSIQARTFERGVEGETPSCGTGAVAIGVVVKALYNWPMPITVEFPRGQHLMVTIDPVRQWARLYSRIEVIDHNFRVERELL